MIVPCGNSLGNHWLGWGLESDEKTHDGLLPLDDGAQVVHVARLDVAALDLDNDLLGLLLGLINKEHHAINALIGPLLLVPGWSCLDEAERPPLELKAVLFSQSLSTAQVPGHSNLPIVYVVSEHVIQTLADEGNGQMGDVYADPPAANLLSSHYGGAHASDYTRSFSLSMWSSFWGQL